MRLSLSHSNYFHPKFVELFLVVCSRVSKTVTAFKKESGFDLSSKFQSNEASKVIFTSSSQGLFPVIGSGAA